MDRAPTTQFPKMLSMVNVSCLFMEFISAQQHSIMVIKIAFTVISYL